MPQSSSSSAGHRAPWWATIGLAVVFAGASLAGLIWADALYTDLAMQLAFLPTDLFNLLVITLPAIVMLVAVREGRSLAMAAWPGYTLYTLYMGILHLWAMPFGAATPVWAIVVVASGTLTAAALLTVNMDRLRRRLGRRLLARFGGGLLVALALPFGLYALGEMIRAVAGGAPVSRLDSMLWLADLTISPACVIAGVALWRRKPLGFTLGPGALVMFAAQFLGLPAVEVFAAVTTTKTVDWPTMAVGLVGGVLCVLALMLRPRERAEAA